MPSRRCSGEFDQKQSAERPEGLSAKALFAFLVDHDDALAGVGDFGCRDQPRQSAADHDYVCVISHCFLPRATCRLKPASFACGQRQMGACLWPRRHIGKVAVFQFGTCARAGCSGPATLDLNLF